MLSGLNHLNGVKWSGFIIIWVVVAQTKQKQENHEQFLERIIQQEWADLPFELISN